MTIHLWSSLLTNITYLFPIHLNKTLSKKNSVNLKIIPKVSLYPKQTAGTMEEDCRCETHAYGITKGKTGNSCNNIQPVNFSLPLRQPTLVFLWHNCYTGWSLRGLITTIHVSLSYWLHLGKISP